MTSDYSITKLFVTKKVTILLDNGQRFYINLPTVTQLLVDEQWNIAYKLWTTSTDKLVQGLAVQLDSTISFSKIVLFELGKYDKFRVIYDAFQNAFPKLFDDFSLDTKNKELKTGDVIITPEIWDYVISILKLSYGEKVTLPPTFDSDEAREFYLAQKKAEEQINAIKSKKQGDPDGLIKTFLSITYAFPSMTFDYLYNQTMAQIQWLQKYAAGSVSYEVNAQAFAAGNMKKSAKLDFFIK